MRLHTTRLTSLMSMYLNSVSSFSFGLLSCSVSSKGVPDSSCLITENELSKPNVI